jgi:hypothetical protein
VLDYSVQNGDLLMVLTENQSWTAPSSCSEAVPSPVNKSDFTAGSLLTF